MEATASQGYVPPAPVGRTAKAAPRSRWRLAAQALGLVAVFGIAILAVVYADVLQDRLAGAGYAAVFVIAAVGAATLILPAPTAVSVGAFAAALDSIWAVGLVAATGQTLGELSGYYVGWSGKGALSHVKGYQRVSGWMTRYGGLTLFVMALIPNPFFDIAGMLAGATRFGVLRFMLVSWPGRAIKNIGFAWAGVAGLQLLGWLTS